MYATAPTEQGDRTNSLSLTGGHLRWSCMGALRFSGTGKCSERYFYCCPVFTGLAGTQSRGVAGTVQQCGIDSSNYSYRQDASCLEIVSPCAMNLRESRFAKSAGPCSDPNTHNFAGNVLRTLRTGTIRCWCFVIYGRCAAQLHLETSVYGLCQYVICVFLPPSLPCSYVQDSCRGWQYL